jgi:hypothetical protein
MDNHLLEACVLAACAACSLTYLIRQQMQKLKIRRFKVRAINQHRKQLGFYKTTFGLNNLNLGLGYNRE